MARPRRRAHPHARRPLEPARRGRDRRGRRGQDAAPAARRHGHLRVTFARLTRGDWVAAVAALALLLVMAMDWYTTEAGNQARKDEKQIQPRGATAGEVGRALDESARIAAEEAEENAWQAEPF